MSIPSDPFGALDSHSPDESFTLNGNAAHRFGLSPRDAEIFHEAGIFTCVSLQPVLDTAAALEIIRQTHRF